MVVSLQGILQYPALSLGSTLERTQSQKKRMMEETTTTIGIKTSDPSDESTEPEDSSSGKWKALAVEKYGKDLAETTSHQYYGGRYRDMIRDDNIRGAALVRSLNNIPCPWFRNSPKYFFICLLVELQFHREDNELRLYLDARGERDLRNPKDSSIVRRSSNAAVIAKKDEDEMITGEFVPEISVPGHHKGYLSFDAGLFTKPGKYYFTFADIRCNASWRKLMIRMETKGLPSSLAFPVRDYPEILLLEIPPTPAKNPDEGIIIDDSDCGCSRRTVSELERFFFTTDAASSKEGVGNFRYTLVSSPSPFQNDTEDIEYNRFAPYVNETLLKRHEKNETQQKGSGGESNKTVARARVLRKWWVDDETTTTFEPQRILLHDPVTKFGAMVSFNETEHSKKE